MSDHPDVGLVLMDCHMPGMDGFETTQWLQDYYPGIPVLALSMLDDEQTIVRMLKLGIKGYLLKDTPSEEIAAAIRSVNLGYTHLGPGMMAKVMSGQIDRTEITLPPELAELTPRELEILKLIAVGANNREIAGQLYISEGTVKNHVTNILNRLNLRDRTQAAILAKTYLTI